MEMFQFDTIQMAPSVKQLVIHLEGKQICRYEANEQDAQEALERHHNTELKYHCNWQKVHFRFKLMRLARQILHSEFQIFIRYLKLVIVRAKFIP